MVLWLPKITLLKSLLQLREASSACEIWGYRFLGCFRRLPSVRETNCMKLADVLHSSIECVVCLNIMNRALLFFWVLAIFWKMKYFGKAEIVKGLSHSLKLYFFNCTCQFLSSFFVFPWASFLSIKIFSLFSYHYECFVILWICFIQVIYMKQWLFVLFSVETWWWGSNPLGQSPQQHIWWWRVTNLIHFSQSSK